MVINAVLITYLNSAAYLAFIDTQAHRKSRVLACVYPDTVSPATRNTSQLCKLE